MGTKISAQVIADSICNGHRITSMLLTYPRFIHSEMCRHRMFSRNTASSRAIPLDKMIEAIKNDPVVPIAWQRDHKGMQGVEYITNEKQLQLNLRAWLSARDNAVTSAAYLNHAVHAGGNVTKQLCNRLLEPWMWTVELVTFTESENFFHLRCPQYVTPHGTFRSIRDIASHTTANVGDYYQIGDRRYLHGMEATFVDALIGGLNKGQAEIHMMAIAEAVWDARNESKPRELEPGQWHIPYGPPYNDLKEAGLIDSTSVEQICLKIATARAAQTSYTVVGEDGKPTSYEKLIALHDRLVASGHWSCFEHCSRAMSEDEFETWVSGPQQKSQQGLKWAYKDIQGWCKNFRGWIQYRTMFPNENKV